MLDKQVILDLLADTERDFARRYKGQECLDQDYPNAIRSLAQHSCFSAYALYLEYYGKCMFLLQEQKKGG